MEVLKFAASLPVDSPLRRAIDKAVSTVQHALHVYSASELAFSFNGGKDSTVVLHVIRAAVEQRRQLAATALLHAEEVVADAPLAAAAAGLGADTLGHHAPTHPTQSPLEAVQVVYFDSPNNFPEVIAFMADASQKCGFQTRQLGGFKEGLATLVREGRRGIFMGTRRIDPDGVNLEHFSPTSLNWPPCMRICPILEWSYAHVWEFLRGVGLNYCNLYDAGFTSLGSVTDSRPNPRLLRSGGGGAAEPSAGGAADIARDHCSGALPADVALASPLSQVTASPALPRYLPAWALPDGLDERLGRQHLREKPR